MTKDEAIEALRATLEPGESVTVERSEKLQPLTTKELADAYWVSCGLDVDGRLRCVVNAYAEREREIMRQEVEADLVERIRREVGWPVNPERMQCAITIVRQWDAAKRGER